MWRCQPVSPVGYELQPLLPGAVERRAEPGRGRDAAAGATAAFQCDSLVWNVYKEGPGSRGGKRSDPPTRPTLAIRHSESLKGKSPCWF